MYIFYQIFVIFLILEVKCHQKYDWNKTGMKVLSIGNRVETSQRDESKPL